MLLHRHFYAHFNVIEVFCYTANLTTAGRPPSVVVMTTLLTADLIRAARAMLGWSQIELATKSGVTQKALSEIELGKKPPSAKSNANCAGRWKARNCNS
ncbi:helix-turn-helix domain-containing protein [Rhizobium leguminosarum]